MSRFYVGQRVRIKGGDSAQHSYMVGAETRISEILELVDENGRDWTGYGTEVFPPLTDADGWIIAFEDHQLEPILDQKHEACDEDFKRDLDLLLERQGVSA